MRNAITPTATPTAEMSEMSEMSLLPAGQQDGDEEFKEDHRKV
jgi:hypothetical protein